MDPNVMLGPVDQLGREVVSGVLVIEFVLLGLVVANMLTRFLAYRRNVAEAAEEDVESLSRHPLHEATNVLLLLGTFYYTTVAPHGGIVLSMFVVGLVIADVFEHEVRSVDLRKDDKPRAPKGALGISAFALAYAGFQSLFFLVSDYWGAII
ncbi:hypothetical protein [Haloarchaeobius sp. FL176]|uniref:DUF7313 family protein n=1 Tax=Haloarchaeobius sp. FL176 TaxID=2967129 RepID=UPI00214758FB|nr:hypothetical protein [Haloarchaeobius sp. FL176]